MPEMPEVEQVRKTLAPRITNKKITSVEVYLDRLVKHPTVEKFVEGLTGKSILEVGRKSFSHLLHFGHFRHSYLLFCFRPILAKAYFRKERNV